MAGQLQSEIKGEISIETVPFMHVEWKLSDVLLLQQDNDHRIHSPSFVFENTRWYLRMTMRSKDIVYGIMARHDPIDLYLVKESPATVASCVNFHIGIKTASGNIYRSHHGESLSIFETDSDCWGIAGLLYRSDLFQEMSCLAPNDVVTFFCYFWIDTPVNLHAVTRAKPFDGQSTAMVNELLNENAGEMSTEIAPLLYVEWKVPNTFFLSEDTMHTIQSPRFQFKDVTWYLKVTINDPEFTQRYAICSPMYLCLLREDCVAGNLFVDYKVGIKTVDGDRYRTEMDDCVFDESASCQIWSNLYNALDKEITVAPNDAVTFFCYFHFRGAGRLDADSRTKMSEGTIAEKSAAQNSSSPSALSWIRKKLNSSSGKMSEKSAAASRPAPRSRDQKLTSSYGSLTKLIMDFQRIYISGEGSDLCIKVKDAEFRVHRTVLRARSSVFHSMLSADMVENSGTISITDCEPVAFNIFLFYIYTGLVKILSRGIIFDLYRVAEKYDAEELKLKCKEFMVSYLSVATVCDVIEHAVQYDDAKLLNTAADFFARNLKKILRTVQWRNFCEKNPLLVDEVLIKAPNYSVLK